MLFGTASGFVGHRVNKSRGSPGTGVVGPARGRLRLHGPAASMGNEAQYQRLYHSSHASVSDSEGQLSVVPFRQNTASFDLHERYDWSCLNVTDARESVTARWGIPAAVKYMARVT